jgi:serine protease inhibitor
MYRTRILILAAATVLASVVSSTRLSAREPVNPAVTANDDFAVDLYRQLAKENAGKNLFFSPYSMSVALTMTAEGARGETALQMGKTLRFPASLRRTGEGAELNPWDMGGIHTGMAALLDRFNPSKPIPREVREKIDRLREDLKAANGRVAELEKLRKWGEVEAVAKKAQAVADELNKLLAPYELRVANALWAEKTYPFQTSYLDTIRTYYRGGAFPVDFVGDADGARKQINAWVEEQTRNRIKDLIPPMALNKRTTLVLTNAIYFKGDWTDPFPEKATRDEDFSLAAGKKEKVPLMHASGIKSARYAAFNGDGALFETPLRIPFSEKEDKFYPDRKGFVALELPYKGDDLSMVFLVPQAEDGLAGLEKLLTFDHLRAWTGKLQQRAVNAFVPRFKLETEYKMKPALEELGMVRAFVDPREPKGAQFDGMSVSKDPMEKLYISKVLHKAFVEVNEKGTEAAAATAVIMARPTSAPVARPFVPTVRADRPFVFLIRDRKTGTILFLGRVLNPKG